MSSTLSVGGLATGIDTASLISQLMAAERQPETILQKKVTVAQNQISAFNQINSTLNSFESVVNGMNTSSSFVSRTSIMTDSSVATASVTSSAEPGTHTIEVDSLAQFQRQISDTSYASSSDLNFNTGTITIGKTGSTDTPVSITIAEGQNSLSGITAAINGSGANVSASIINDGTGYRLIVTGKDTNNYTVDASGLTTAPAASNGTSYIAPTFDNGIGYLDGRPASFTIDGIAMTRTSNTISDVIPGVTLNLLKDGGSSTTLTVTNDTASVTSKINSFVSAYNSVMTLIGQQDSYNATTKTAGTLAGDSTVRDIKSQLQSIISSAVSGVSGSYSCLSALGITTNYQDGTLTVDSTKLDKALKTNFDAVSDLFTHNSGTPNLASKQYGIAQRLSTSLDQITHIYDGDSASDNGEIATRIKGLNDQINDTNKQISDMETLLAQKQDQLQKQYANMESVVSSLQSNGNALLAALSALTTTTTTNSSSSSK
jgi:flagellar hook-associated protein 2